MSSLSICRCIALSVLVCLAGSPRTVHAQRAAAPVRRPAAETKPGESVRIRRFVGTGAQSKVKTPAYRTNMPSGTKRTGEWIQVMTVYDTAPEWIDELVFQYHVLTLDREGGSSAYSLFKNVVRYADVKQDRNHMSTVFLHPRAVDRYGEVVATAVEIVLNGRTEAQESEIDPRVKLPADWWTNPAVLNSESLTVRDGYLKNRAESPFALINYDDYEVIK